MSQPSSESLPGRGRVVRLSLLKVGPDTNLAIRVREQTSDAEIQLEFTHITDLQFRGASTGFDELVTLRAEPLESDGAGPARYRVFDLEDEFVAFRCSGWRRDD